MTNGTSQGLFIVVAIVIFGVFVALSYTVFGDQLTNGISGLFSDSIEQTELKLGNIVEDETEFDSEQNYKVYNDFAFIPISEDTARIVTYLGYDTDLVIPDTLVDEDTGNEYTVTSIGNFSFYSGDLEHLNPINIKLESVVLPETITEIRQHAFQRNHITEITIPNSVVEIHSQAFSVNRIESLIIPDSVEYIGPRAFRDNRLETLHLGDGVTTIDIHAFRRNRLTEVTFGSNLNELADGLFQFNRLTNIDLPDNIQSIGERTFRDNNITTVELPNGVTYIENSEVSSFDEGIIISDK